MNAVTYPTWKKTNAVFLAQVMLDCMVSDFIESASHIEGMEKIVRHTAKGRAVGLGITGLHTHMQAEGMIFGEWDSMMFNNEIYKHLREQSDLASQWLAVQLGEPEWCIGSGFRNTHRLAQMPNKSSSLIFGQVSEGINPMTGNVFNQRLSTGEAFRINPNFIKLLKGKGKFNDSVLASVSHANGSCQHLDFLTTYEKALFRTAFEIPQHDVLSMAEQRQQKIDQSQSLNLFIPQNATARYVAELHIRAINSKLLKNLYYVNTANADYNVIETCSACES
jgi:ribonucleoside-diphosphate reductase alpha chain